MPVDEPLYPVNLRVAGRRCLVVGGGRVAADKVAGLLECGARVHVVAPELGEALADRVAAAAGADGGRLTWDQRPYRAADLDGRMLVIVATDSPAITEAVHRDAERAGVLVNAADDPEHCTFTLPARVRRGRLLVTFATGGHSPALATWLRRRFESEFGPEYDTLIDVLSDARAAIRAEGRSTEGLDWQGALDSGMLELIRQGRVAEAKERLQACLSS
ncbi:MAG: bifunctional precorrin-2 dehydrogenase/sirohydrochlorin ferrochelatase [Acidimicrobiales bacterium]|nr:bifunctional precorrin-2 dehydrogenase/sirohydrochlorin ferrochelatase [Acidimicrobiales bacterium]MCB9372495.1 bifunctional precorrin-2 dehydrogenase/sirohydrochlorin ferrochelatase [Microthrixaceae bacterium]